LPKLLRDSGFLTQAVVTHLYLSKQYGFGEGFDRHVYLPETRAEQVTDRGIGFLRSHGDRDFFLFLHYYDPHWHYDPPAPYDRVFDPDYSGTASGIWWDFKNYTAETIDPRDLQHIIALYDGEILYVDHQLDRFLGEMKRLGVFDETLVVVTSDHGEEFLDHGGWEHQKTLYEEQIRVPLIVKLPGGAHRREKVSRQVSLLDVAPTVLDVLDLPEITAFQGRSLLALVGSRAGQSPQNAVWAETEHTVDGSHKLSLRRGASAAKLIFGVNGRERGDTLVELYDLGHDVGETVNLMDSNPNAAAGELSRLEEFLDHIADFRRGATPAKPVELSPEQLDRLRALGYVR
jgi:arylsulfatase A-like enzyme